MLLGHDVARLRHEFGTEFAAPGAEFEGFSRPGHFLNWCNVLPGFVVARTVSTMHRIENPQSSFSRSAQQLQHMRDAVIGLCDAFDAIPYFAALGNEIVVRVDDY